MKKTTTQLKPVIVLVVAACLLTAGVAMAKGQRGAGRGLCVDGPGDRAEMRIERMTKNLDLSEDQVAVIMEIRESYQQKNLELKKELMRLRNERRGEMLEDNPSEKAVIDLTQQMGDLKTQLQVNRMKMRLEVGNQLTPEQRDKMLVMRAGSGKGGPGRGFAGPRGHRGHDGRGGSRGRCRL